MKLIYHNDWRGNFGDDINLPFFDIVIPGYEEKLLDQKLYGIGTLLNNNNGLIRDACIFGSGFGYGEELSYDLKSTKIFGVRGPVTAKKMGLDSSYIIGDPAIYVSSMPSIMPEKTYSTRAVVALHHRSAEMWDFSGGNNDELYFLDPGLTSIPDYIGYIRDASVVYAESLHAAIIAATFGVPFCPVSIGNKLEEKKWSDFYQLFGFGEFEPLTIPAPAVSVIRRISVSGRVRGVLQPSKLGRKVNAEYFKHLVARLNEINRKANCRVSDVKMVSSIKTRIENAISELRQYVDKG